MNKDWHFQHQENCPQKKGFCIMEGSRGQGTTVPSWKLKFRDLMCKYQAVIFANKVLRLEEFNYPSCPTKSGTVKRH